jgi:aryl-alcohol dehydrogenase-like predicted oxidoreductase
MSYGSSEWQPWVLNEADSLPLLEHAYKSGINTWDTADIYSHGQSERIIGKALKQFNIPRNKVVLLSKCYFGVDESNLGRPIAESSANNGDTVNEVGLSRKHIFDAVEKSVERLGTHIDVLQIHRLDRETPREEIMKALNDVIEKGWVRYIGASSMAAWEFQTLQIIAEKHGWHKFVSMQNYYNLIYREEEREMVRTHQLQLPTSSSLTASHRSRTAKTPASASSPGPPSRAAPSRARGLIAPPSAPGRTSLRTHSYTSASLPWTRRLLSGSRRWRRGIASVWRV